MRLEFDIEIEDYIPVDLLQLVPEVYRDSELIKEFMEESSFRVTNWLTKIKELVKLQSPTDLTNVKYLRHLGKLLGVDFINVDNSDIVKIQKQILNATDWYKIKGTYSSLNIVAAILGFVSSLQDMYTNDYAIFKAVDPREWFFGREEEENPPGLDSSYYKSPHFGFRILLQSEVSPEPMPGVDFYPYLWTNVELQTFIRYMDFVRPVNTVPHFTIVALPIVDDSNIFIVPYSYSFPGGDVTLSSGGYASRRLVDYDTSPKLYFDESHEPGGREAFFDDGIYFFDAFDMAFLNSMTGWKIGTGNDRMTQMERAYRLLEPDFDLETPVYSGSFPLVGSPERDEVIVVRENMVTFILKVPIGEDLILGVSECGLYVGDQLVIASLFPNIDKSELVELEIEFSVSLS